MAAIGALPGVKQTSLNAAALDSAAGAGQEFSLLLGPRGVPNIVWSVVFSAAPTSHTTALEASLDGTNWFVIDTTSNTAGALRSVEGSYPFLRINNSAVVDGAGKTITATLVYTCGIKIEELVPDFYTKWIFAHDAIGAISSPAPGAVASGTSLFIAGIANHPGRLQLSSSASANSGVTFMYSGSTVAGPILLSGKEKFQLVAVLTTLTNTTTKVGFHDSFDHNAPTDGAFINISGTTLTGKTTNNTTVSTTTSSYTVSAGIYYRFVVEVNDNATQVRFSLYNSDTGDLLWTDVLSTNIPTTTGREVSVGLVTTNSAGGTAILATVDFHKLELFANRA